MAAHRQGNRWDKRPVHHLDGSLFRLELNRFGRWLAQLGR